MPIITLPDGSKKDFEKSVTILEIAQSIGAGLAKASIAGKVNDVLLDATIPINEDSKVVIITSKDKEGIEIIRHSFAHLIGHAVKQIYSDIKMAIGPVIEDGFYYDIFSEYRFTPEDLIKIENRIDKLIKTNYDVEILQVSKEEAIKTFKERNETFKLRIIEEIPEEPEPSPEAQIPLEELNLSVRAYNCLKRAQVNSVSDLMGFSYEDLLEIKNFGSKSADEVIEALERIGISIPQSRTSV